MNFLRRHPALLAVALAVYLAVGWLLGLVIFIVAVLRFARRIVRFRAALSESSRCHGCGAVVPHYGRFSCQQCGSVQQGWVFRCRWCGAYAGFTPCGECGLSIPNPAVREVES